MTRYELARLERATAALGAGRFAESLIQLMRLIEYARQLHAVEDLYQSEQDRWTRLQSTASNT